MFMCHNICRISSITFQFFDTLFLGHRDGPTEFCAWTFLHGIGMLVQNLACSAESAYFVTYSVTLFVSVFGSPVKVDSLKMWLAFLTEKCEEISATSKE